MQIHILDLDADRVVAVIAGAPTGFAEPPASWPPGSMFPGRGNAPRRFRAHARGGRFFPASRSGCAGLGDTHAEGLEFAQRAADEGLRSGDRRRRLRRALTEEGPCRAGKATKPPRSVAPIPKRTQFAAQLGVVLLGMHLDELADPLNIGGSQFPPLHDHDACHRCKIEPFSN